MIGRSNGSADSIPPRAEQDTHEPPLLEAALSYARRGVPVFPLRAGTKQPLKGSRGFYEATTDEDRIRRWWRGNADFNIGTPTGERGGILALDIDGEEGRKSLSALEMEHAALPATASVDTPNDGEHRYLSFPPGCGVGNSAGRIGPGLDVRGEGGYVVLPPSRLNNGRSYRWAESLAVADPPAWLLEASRPQPKPAKTREVGRTPEPGEAAPVSIDTAGEPIPHARRNDTLARIAGRLHDGTRTLAQLRADLEAVNRARCVPPIGEHPDDRDPGEVARIAASIHSRRPCDATPEAEPEALEELAAIEHAHLWGSEWRGIRWKVPRSVFVALIKEARKHGRLIPAGVRISLSTRALALAAAASHPSTLKAIKLLREEGLLRKDDEGRSGTRAGAFVLAAPSLGWTTARATFNHSSIERRTRLEATGKTLRAPGEGGYPAPLSAPRLRWSSPAQKSRRGLVKGTRKVRESAPKEAREFVRRMGKSCEMAVDVLERAGGELPIEDLAAEMGVSRPRDLRRRVVARLEEARVVAVDEDGNARLVPDWLDNLNEERELTGELEVYRQDLRRFNRDRMAYRERLERAGIRPQTPPPIEEVLRASRC